MVTISKLRSQSGRMGVKLIIVAEGKRGCVYLAPTKEMENIALKVKPEVETGK